MAPSFRWHNRSVYSDQVTKVNKYLLLTNAHTQRMRYCPLNSLVSQQQKTLPTLAVHPAVASNHEVYYTLIG